MGMAARGETRGDRGEGEARGEPVAAVAIIPALVYDEHAGALRGFLTRLTGDAVASEDLAHEAFVRLLVEIGEGRPPVHVRAWLFRVAANLAASRGRHRGVAARRAAELVPRGVVPSPEDELLEREAARALHRTIAKLPADVRTALLLTALGYSGAEVARRIGRSELATRSLLCRYRGRLRANQAA
jgi:RNA polymerase sigma factor (sigma-70 family)